MRAIAALRPLLDAQRGHLFPWSPVVLGAGIALYFALPLEPSYDLWVLALLSLAAGALLVWRLPPAARLLGWTLLLISLGFCAAGLRAHLQAAPALSFRYYGPVEGRLIALSRSPADRVRVTLDQVRLDRVPPQETPATVRVTLHGDASLPPPGARVMTTAHLMPPQGPAEPGGFDFRRHAWFQRLGAVGYTRVPLLMAGGGAPLPLESLRRAAGAHIKAAVEGERGGFAAAITTGDRSAVSTATLDSLRASNLAHLLAISGLHMGLLAGVVFGGLRLFLSLFTPVALRLPVKKLAACGALGAAAGYLALSGGNVATERAFIMAAVMLGAVLLDQRALSLRAVALAALIVLLRRPESLLGPGFQMSFAATTALVGVFSRLRDAEISLGPKWLRPLSAAALSSLVAGLATAPFGAAHFNMVSHYGLLANLLAVPVMGAVVMPAAVLALLLTPLGLGWAGWAVMGQGLGWILRVAEFVSGLEGARGQVIAPGPMVLPLVAFGGLILILWQGRLRLTGALPLLMAFVLWQDATRPRALIADTGGLIGVLTPEGRALSKPKGAGFIAGIWLENDGDPVLQDEAAARWPGAASKLQTAQVAGTELIHVIGKHAAETYGTCEAGQIAVFSVPKVLEGECLVLDPVALRKTGAVLLTEDGKLITAKDRAGARPWTGEGPQLLPLTRRLLALQ